MITVQMLRAIGATAARAEQCLEPLKAACAMYGIDTPERVAMFLANIGHESGGLKYTRELWGPTKQQLRYEGTDLAVRLGNTEIGDGYKYRGGGFIQNTGRDNYRRLTQRLSARFPDVPDFEAHPEALEDIQWAALAAADYWDEHGLNKFADAGDFDGVCDMINRGRKTYEEGDSNGYADRLARLEKVRPILLAQGPLQVSQAIEPKKEQVVAPFIAAVLPSLVSAVGSAVPELIKMFGGGSDISERNSKAAEVLVGVAKEAIGAVNEQDLVEQMAKDPETVETVRQAIKDNWYQIQEVGGGIQAARETNLKIQGDRNMFYNPAVWISFVLLIFPSALCVDVFYVHPGAEYYSENIRTQIVTALLAVIMVVSGYWLGSSSSSKAKDEALAKRP